MCHNVEVSITEGEKVKDIIKVSIDEPTVYYVIYTRDKSYNCYGEITLSLTSIILIMFIVTINYSTHKN